MSEPQPVRGRRQGEGITLARSKPATACAEVFGESAWLSRQFWASPVGKSSSTTGHMPTAKPRTPSSQPHVEVLKARRDGSLDPSLRKTLSSVNSPIGLVTIEGARDFGVKIIGQCIIFA